MSEVQWRGKSREDDIRDGPGPDHSAFEASIKAFLKVVFYPGHCTCYASTSPLLRFQTYSLGLNEMLGEKSLEGKSITESFLKSQRLERAEGMLRRLVWSAPTLEMEPGLTRGAGSDQGSGVGGARGANTCGACVLFVPTIRVWLPFSEARGEEGSEHRIIVICQGSHGA